MAAVYQNQPFPINDFNGLSMRHLQIINTERYARDFDVSEILATRVQGDLYNSIEYFLVKIRGTGRALTDIHIRATNIPLLITSYLADVIRDGRPYPFSRSVRVAEDYYQRIRKLVTNETSPDFNLMTTDECGNPYTFITRIEDYQRTFRVGFQSVLAINSWIKRINDQFKTTTFGINNMQVVLTDRVTATPSKAPVCAEVNEMHAMHFYEDIYCRWRNVVFNCKNLLPSGNELKSDTLMALYYTSLDQAKLEAIPCLKKHQRFNAYE